MSTTTSIEFSDADDWRTGPDKRRCQHCTAAETSCAAKRMLSGRRCCAKCSDGSHPVKEGRATYFRLPR